MTTTVSVTCAAAELSYISAVYTQSGTVYTTDTLDSLKSDLVVTATYDDSTTSTVASADYTLSGTLTVGTSSVTVTYEGKTTTFSVTVSANTALYPMTDGSVTFTESVYADRTLTVSGNHVTYTDPTATETGSDAGSYIIFDDVTTNLATPDTTNINQTVKTLFTIPSGSNVVFDITNISCTVAGSPITNRKKFAIALRQGSTSKVTTGDLTTETSKTVTQTVSSATAINCAFVYMGAAISKLEFYVSLTVNGDKWI